MQARLKSGVSRPSLSRLLQGGLLGCMLAVTGCASGGGGSPAPTPVPTPTPYPYQEASLPTEARVDDLLSRMTLREKVGQMTLVEKNSIGPDEVRDRMIGALLSGGGGFPNSNTVTGWARMVDTFQESALETRLQIPMLYGVDAVAWFHSRLWENVKVDAVTN